MNKYLKKAAALLLSVLLVIPIGTSALSESTSALKIRPMQLPDELSAPDTVISVWTAGKPYASEAYYGADKQWWGMAAYSAVGYTNKPLGTVTFSAAESLLPYLQLGLKLDSTETETDRVNGNYDYARWGVIVSALFPAEKQQSLNGAEGIMLYVRMSENAKQFVPYFVTSGTRYDMCLKTGNAYYILSKGGAEWQRLTGENGDVAALPESGFEGYVYFPRESIMADNWDLLKLARLQIQFGRYGGEEGAAYFSQPIIVLGDPLNSSIAEAELENGEKSPLFYNNDKYLNVRGITLPTETADMGKTLITVNPLSAGDGGYFGGAWWGLASNENNPVGKVTLSAAPNFSPLYGCNFKLDSTVTEYDRVNNLEDYARRGLIFDAALSAENAVSLKNGTGIIFYVRMAADSKQMAAYFIPEKSASWKMCAKTNLPYYTFAEGDSDWKISYGGDNELIDLPQKGFRGYVFIPKSTLSSDDGTDWDSDSIYRFVYQFGRYGGADGAVYFTPPAVTLGNPLTVLQKNSLKTEDGTEDLFREFLFKNGDSNEDGKRDIKDMIALKKMISFNTPKTETADFNRDGSTDALDLSAYKKFLLSGEKNIAAFSVSAELFERVKDSYGCPSINILGDSISHGANAPEIPKQAYTALLKNSVAEKFGAWNYGYTSMRFSMQNYFGTYNELHSIAVSSGAWQSGVGTQLGFNYYRSCDDTAELTVTVGKEYSGRINGMYVYYQAGPNEGSFDVAVGENTVATVVCTEEKADLCARSMYIPLPGISENSEFKIIKKPGAEVTVNGIAYYENPSVAAVQNYSNSGQCLVDIKDEVIRSVCKAPVVLIAIGHNDAGMQSDFNAFKEKVELIIKTCRETGAQVAVVNTIWNCTSEKVRYRDELKKITDYLNGTYIDFSDIISENPGIIQDGSHPTVAGHRIIAERICRYLDLPFKE